jgi:hypothetical protein
MPPTGMVEQASPVRREPLDVEWVSIASALLE